MIDEKDIVCIFDRFALSNPDPKCELDSVNNYTFMIAVMLSARCTDKSVNKITKNLFNLANSPKKMLDLGLSNLESIINRLGLWRNKARNIIDSSIILIDKYNGEVPGDMESLLILPGIGRKSANVVLSVCFDQSVIAVDTHVARTSNRIGLVNGLSDPNKIEKQLMQKIPKYFLKKAHHWLVLHGRYICKSQKPLCHKCPINDICEFYRQSSSKNI